MEKFNFKEGVSSFTEKQLELVISVFEKQGFEGGNVTLHSVGKAGDNFAASVKRIIIEKDDVVFKIIAKISPAMEQQRMANNLEVVFNNEYVMYTKVLPKFTELEINASIEENERLKYANCYGIIMEPLHEMILFEDLSESGFCMLNKLVPLKDDKIRFVLKECAKLHSLSFVLKNQDQETYASFASELDNLWSHFDKMDDMQYFLSAIEAEIISFVEDEKSKNVIRGSLTQLTKITIEKVTKDRGSKYSVIQHGDAWTNNIMFKLEDNKTIECCMIDYQLSNETNPAADILYLIFNCTDYDTRKSNFHDWIDYYYHMLTERLEKFGLKVNDVYSRTHLDADLKRMGKLAFGQAIMASFMLLRETHEAKELQDVMQQAGPEADMDELLEKMKLSNLGQVSMDRFKERFYGLMKSLFEQKYNE